MLICNGTNQQAASTHLQDLHNALEVGPFAGIRAPAELHELFELCSGDHD